MSRARVLADYVSSGDELADKAPLAGPTFTGTVAIPNVANLETAVVANTAKVTNYNQTLADINALDITELGTVTSGTLGTSVVFPSFVGMIAPFAMTSPPAGWLACDGSAVSRTVTYSALFAALSTTWGVGDGSSTFNVPDLEGAFLRGTGGHGTNNMSNGSDYAGPSVGAFAYDKSRSHRHSSQAWGDSGGGTPNVPNNGVQAMPIQYQQIQLLRHTSWGAPYTTRYTNSSLIGDTWVAPANPATSNGYTTIAANYTSTAETHPFNAGVKYCIKY